MTELTTWQRILLYVEKRDADAEHAWRWAKEQEWKSREVK
jgi:hypothetical protein